MIITLVSKKYFLNMQRSAARMKLLSLIREKRSRKKPKQTSGSVSAK